MAELMALDIAIRTADRAALDALARVERAGVATEQRMNQATERVVAQTARTAQASATSATRALAGAQQQTSALAQRFGMATLQMSQALETAARTGNVMGEPLRQVIAQGSQMAFTFGLGGPIVAAIGIAATSLYQLFANARKQMEETRAKALAEAQRLTEGLNVLQERGDVGGLTDVARRAAQGDPIRGVPSLREIEARRAFLDQQAGILRAAVAQRKAENTGLFDQAAIAMDRMAADLDRRVAAFDRLIEDSRRKIADAMRRAQSVPGQPGARGLMGQPVNITAPGAGGAAGAAAPGFTPPGLSAVTAPGLAGLAVPNVAVGELPSFKAAREQIERDAAKLQDTVQTSVAQGVGGAIMSAFSAAFNGEGIVGIISAFGKSVLQSMMGMFANAIATMAAKLEIWGKIASAFSKAFAALGPWAGPAAIAAGIAMMALARSMGGGGAGAGGIGSQVGRFGGAAVPGYGAGQTVRYNLPAQPAPSITAMGAAERVPAFVYAPTIIGTNDPQAQRDVARMVEGAWKQGVGAASRGSYRRQSGV